MSVTVCLAPAQTIEYPQGGGHLWVYLNWALGLRRAGCKVVWLEGVRQGSIEEQRGHVAALETRLAPYGFADCISLWTDDGQPLSEEVVGTSVALEDAAADADLLLNLFCRTPQSVIRRFRRSALVD